jgi:hypothetical protein
MNLPSGKIGWKVEQQWAKYWECSNVLLVCCSVKVRQKRSSDFIMPSVFRRHKRRTMVREATLERHDVESHKCNVAITSTPSIGR